MGSQKIGLVLSAGSAKGLAHIGVLKVLEAHDVPIEFITGTSIGSLVGGLYAAGIGPDMQEGLALNIAQKKWIDIGVPRKGFIRGDKILKILKMLSKGEKIETLKIPFACVSADLITGRKVVHKDGSLAEAIRSSISIPGVFDPFETQGKMLVDGAVLDRLPVNLCRELGANKVISVDVSTMAARESIDSIFDVIVQSMNIMQAELVKFKHTKSDLLIQPNVEEISPNQFHRAEEAIEAGENACLRALPEIKALVGGVQTS